MNLDSSSLRVLQLDKTDMPRSFFICEFSGAYKIFLGCESRGLVQAGGGLCWHGKYLIKFSSSRVTTGM